MLEYTHHNLVAINPPRKNETDAPYINISEPERMLSLVGGIAIAFAAIARRKEASIPAFLASAYLLFRGVSGHCVVYDHFGVNMAASKANQIASMPHEPASKAETSEVPADDIPTESLE